MTTAIYVPSQIADISQLPAYLGRPNNKVIVATRPFQMSGSVTTPTNANNCSGTSQVRHNFPVAASNVQLMIVNYQLLGAGPVANGPIICSAAIKPTTGASTNNCKQLTINGGKRYVVIPPKGSVWTDDCGITLAVGGQDMRVWTSCAPNFQTAVIASGGALPNGTQQFYRMTWVAEGYESGTSQELNCTPSGANLSATLSWLALPPNVDFVKIYRNTVANTIASMTCIAVLPACQGLTYTDAGGGAVAGSVAGAPAFGTIPVYQIIPRNGTLDNSNYASQAGNGADLTLDNSADFTIAGSAFYSHIPAAIAGIPLGKNRSIALIGDSRTVGQNSSTGRDGPFKTVLDTDNTIPYVHLAEGGITNYHYIIGTGKPDTSICNSAVQTDFVERCRLINMCKYALWSLSINDNKSLMTLANMKLYALQTWADLAARGLRVIAETLAPYCPLTTDGYATIAKQQVQTGGRAAILQSFNQWLRAGIAAGAGNSALFDAGGNLYKVWDTARLIEYNSDGSLIQINATTGAITNGTADGGRWPVGTVVASGTVTTGGTTTFSDSNTAFTGFTNAQYVLWTGGSNSDAAIGGYTTTTGPSTWWANYIRAISSVTLHQVTFGVGPTNPIVIGDTYNVYTPPCDTAGLHQAQTTYNAMQSGYVLSDLVAY